MSCAARAWIHILEHCAIAKNLKETQRQVLINTTGAYRTSPLQALCVISNNPLILIKLKESQEQSDRARGLTQETRVQIRTRMLNNWQAEWDDATTGRYSHELLPSVEERQRLDHLEDSDHGVVQFLTGHGPYKGYLMRFRRSDTDRCEDCGGLDNSLHPILECPVHEDQRNLLHRKAIEVGETPWNISTLIRQKETFEALKAAHTANVVRRQV